MGEREAKLNVTKALASKGWVEDEVSGDWPCREGQYADSKGDAVDGKGHKTTGSYPVHEPGHAGVGHEGVAEVHHRRRLNDLDAAAAP